MKIVIIGGGSSYTPELIEGIIQKKSSLNVREIVLVDIPSGKKKLDINLDLAKRMLNEENMNVEISCTINRKVALLDADFIITQIRVGGLKARALDERIPLKYNLIGQETTGAGGFAKALRTLPVIFNICEDIEKYSKKNAWLINFTNPAGIITEAVLKHTDVNVIGLCNVPYNMRVNIAESMNVSVDRVKVDFAGLNHMVYGKRVYLDGCDVTKEVIDQLIAGASNTMNNIPDLDYPETLLKSLKMVPCPYHKYFYMTQELLEEEKKSLKNHGKTRAEVVMDIEKDLFEIYKNPSLTKKPEALEKRGGAYYSKVAISLIDSIINDTRAIHPVNVMNNGAIKGLPDEVVVEINAIITKNGPIPLIVGELPKEVLGLIQRVKIYEELTIEAVVEKDKLKAIQALYNNPLVNSFEKAEKIFYEIVKKNSDYISID